MGAEEKEKRTDDVMNEKRCGERGWFFGYVYNFKKLKLRRNLTTKKKQNKNKFSNKTISWTLILFCGNKECKNIGRNCYSKHFINKIKFSHSLSVSKVLVHKTLTTLDSYIHFFLSDVTRTSPLSLSLSFSLSLSYKLLLFQTADIH